MSGLSLCNLAQLRHGVVAGLGGAGRKTLLLHELDVGECGGAGNWIASKCGKMIAGFIRSSNFRARGECAQRKTIRNALRGHQNVGFDAVVFDGKHLSRAGKAGLDFVRNKEDAMAVENFLHFREVIGRRDNDSAFAHDRFRDECSHIVRGGEPDHVFNGPGALPSTFLWIVRPLRTIGIGRGREGHAGRIRSATLFASHVAGDAERAPAASVKAGVQRDEFMLPGVQTGQLHGAFDGFGAAVAEECFGQAAGRDVRQLFRQVGNRLHVIDVGRAVDKLVHLRLGGGDHAGIAVPGVNHGNAGKAIEIFAAVDIGDGNAAGLVDHNGHD